MATTTPDLAGDFSGLDTLEAEPAPTRSSAARLWAATWPKLAAVALALLAWQAVVWSGWKPEYVLPGPVAAFEALGESVADGTLLESLLTTMRRAVVGFAFALVVGVALGLAVARTRVLRTAVGSMITGLQTMPSIAWFPLAIVLFQLSEGAMFFVVVIGAAPSIANGIITGIDHIPPLLLRAGRVLGARGLATYRHVVLPAALPGFVAGLKQGWAFSWRSLMAGELLVTIRDTTSLGHQLEVARQFSDYPGLLATMIAILVVGIAVDGLVFGRLDRAVRRRWGLLEA